MLTRNLPQSTSQSTSGRASLSRSGRSSTIVRLGRLTTALLSLAWAACQPVPEGDIAAQVGDRWLTVQELDSRIPSHMAGRIGPDRRLQAAEEWVEEELLYQEALQLELDVEPAIADRIDSVVRDLLVSELLDRRLNDAPQVSEADIQAYYDANPDDFLRPTEEIRARHILVATRSEANAIWKRLKSGDLLDQVAREESIDISAEDGGDLGYFTEDMVSPAFWEACRKAPMGRSVRERTPLGNHVIEVLDRREAGTVKDLTEVRGEIRQRLLRERREGLRAALLAELRGRVEWRVTAAAEGGAPAADTAP